MLPAPPLPPSPRFACPRRYVLDIRDNPGGVFEAALGIAGFFNGKGSPVVSVVDGFGTSKDYAATEAQIVRAEAPLVILVDRGTASASEVLAGALKDTCRAVVVGDRTFGKGVIQGVFGLRNGGAVILTMAEYRSPSGSQINGLGVQPTQPMTFWSAIFPPLLSRDISASLASQRQLSTQDRSQCAPIAPPVFASSEARR